MLGHAHGAHLEENAARGGSDLEESKGRGRPATLRSLTEGCTQRLGARSPKSTPRQAVTIEVVETRWWKQQRGTSIAHASKSRAECSQGQPGSKVIPERILPIRSVP